MSELQVCEQCRRHIRVSETVCPFCSGLIGAATRSPVRAAIFAGAIAGATAMGCGDAKPAVEGPQPDHQQQVAESDAQVAAPIDTEEVVDAQEEVVDEPEEVELRRRLPNMPYGAPPARKRLV